MVQILIDNMEIVVQLAFAVVSLFILPLLYRQIRRIGDEDAQKEAIAAIDAAVAKTQDEFVDWAKRASKDGKLTTEDRKTALKMAGNFAKDLATGPGKKLLLAWGKDKLEAVIASRVQRKSE